MSRLRLILPRLNLHDRGMVFVFVGHGVRLILGFLSSALLARGLGPRNLGIVSLLAGSLMILVSLSDLGLSNSVVKYLAGWRTANPGRIPSLARTYGLMRWASGVLIGIMVFSMGDFLSELIGLPDPDGIIYLRIAALGVVATSTSGIVSTLLRSMQNFPALAGMQVTSAALTFLLIGVFYLTRALTVSIVILIGVFASLATASMGYIWLRTKDKLVHGERPLLFWKQAKVLWGFGKWIWISTIFAVVLSQLDLFMINRFLNVLSAGYYALALNISLKVDIVNQTLFIVLLPAVSMLANKREVKNYLRQNLIRSGLLALVISLGFFLSNILIPLIYGENYALSVPIFKVLLGVVLFDVLSLPVLLLAYPLNAPKTIAATQVLRVILMWSLSPILISLYGVLGAGLAKILAKVGGAVFLGSIIWIKYRAKAEAWELGLAAD